MRSEPTIMYLFLLSNMVCSFLFFMYVDLMAKLIKKKKNIERRIEDRFDIFEDIDEKKKKKREKEIKRRNKKKKENILYDTFYFSTSRMYIRTKRKSDDDISSFFFYKLRWNDFFLRIGSITRVSC